MKDQGDMATHVGADPSVGVRAQQRITQLEHDIAAIRASTTYRLARQFATLGTVFAPPATARRRVAGRLARAMVRLVARVTRVIEIVRAPRRFSAPEHPTVSVIVPIHGKWRYTRACLTALHRTRSATPFEIIVVDDKSPDASLRRLKRLRGVRVVALAENVGYVGACNAGIAVANGEFIVLLNNDTRVTRDWLDPLVARITQPGIGLVGARLIYPNGSLQDAGGIVFRDGSAWNYGKHLLATSHDFMYARDADYVSGACTIIRKATLDRLGGGLDERFAPAYYDDTDLAFAVRNLGLRVMYEPRSIVIHDEGISHGTDINQGVKRYQVENQTKFVEKWSDALKLHCEPSADVVPWAARRLQGKSIVAVFDDIVPTPDVDSGSVRRFAFLVALRNLGHHVILAVDSAARPEPYVAQLLEEGIEVLDPANDPLEALAPLEEHLAAIFVARAPVAVGHMYELRRQFPKVPLIFDTVDLHFLRGARERALETGEAEGREIDFLRDIELAIMRSADLTLVVSEVEQALLEELAPDCPVDILSNVHELPAEPSPIAGRRGIMFVGSFAHAPNISAVDWYLREVHPLVRDAIGEYPVWIVGKDAPQELMALADAEIEFLGWVENLEPLYSSARVSIAPLLYGAGVKGKIGEALAHGVPVVMTSVGAEGMGMEHGHTALIADDPGAFAAEVIKVIQNDELWSDLSLAGRGHVAASFGREKFVSDLTRALSTVSKAGADSDAEPGQ